MHEFPIRDASSNPATARVHQYHLGLWFNDPAAAQAAGCGGAVTPFNGDHHAGVQVLSTRQAPALNGPLRKCSADPIQGGSCPAGRHDRSGTVAPGYHVGRRARARGGLACGAW